MKEHPMPCDAFITLWDSIYTDNPASNWHANPWVWVVEFERIENYKIKNT